MAGKNRKNKDLKNRIKSIKNTVFWLLAGIIFFGILGYTFTQNIRIGTVRTQYLDKIDALQKQIKNSEDKRALLEKGLSKVGEKEYLEEVARKQFGLKAPGEEVAVILKDQEVKEGGQNIDSNNVPVKENIWNPKIWWRWIIGK